VARSYRDGTLADQPEDRGVPDGLPPTFAKFPSSVTGPDTTIELGGDSIDWEVELVVVIGTPMYRVPEAEVLSHVAGLTLGQDLTDRALQRSGPVPQFALAKSSPGFTPIGPVIVTLDEVDDLDALELTCRLNGEVVQRASLRQLAYPLPTLLARLSRAVVLLPGDLVFTGTPGGSGMTRTPQRYLRPGDLLESTATGVGTLRQAFR
jgi:2-keto-4-pentenoate hydratase/2-oxohepta-3-ene-1,7-dioic acid hydratase in catechol pathway